MTVKKTLAIFLLTASLSGPTFAQKPVALDDEAIFVAVEEVLQGTPALAAARIIVIRSQDGFITLGGSAASVKDIATAERLASNVRGVTGVRNEVRITDRPWRA